MKKLGQKWVVQTEGETHWCRSLAQLLGVFDSPELAAKSVAPQIRKQCELVVTNYREEHGWIQAPWIREHRQKGEAVLTLLAREEYGAAARLYLTTIVPLFRQSFFFEISAVDHKGE